MGNNPCKKMGVAGKTIGSAELRALWQQYDKNKDGRLSRSEALVFFKDFAKAVGGVVTEEDAGVTFDQVAGAKGYLTTEEFGRCTQCFSKVVVKCVCIRTHARTHARTHVCVCVWLWQ
jgi:hypothetical protein